MRICALPRRVAALAALLFVFSASAHRCDAGINPVRLRVAGVESTRARIAAYDGRELYLSLEALPLFAAKYALNSRGDCAIVTFADGSSSEIALARLLGAQMLPYSLISSHLDASMHVEGGLCEIRPHLTQLYVQDGKIFFTTGFPVRAAVHAGNTQTEVELTGASVGSDFRAPRTAGEPRLSGVRVEATHEGVRVVLAVPAGVSLATAPAEPQRRFALALAGSPRPATAPVRVAEERPRAAARVSGGEAVDVRTPRPGAPRVDIRPTPCRVALTPPTGVRAAVQTADAVDSRTAGGISPRHDGDRGPTRTSSTSASIVGQQPDIAANASIVRVKGIELGPSDPSHADLKVATAGLAAVTTRVLSATRLALDIPNCAVEGEARDWEIKNPLITAVHAVPGEQPGITRLVLDLARAVHYRVTQPADDGFVISLAVRGATRLAGATIVIDPGHGGSPDCASAVHNGTRVYEKDITLGVARKLRQLLDDAGANVLMTRTADTAVALTDRPRVANENNAAVFVSIHSDDCPKPNTASGTTTYYHMDDYTSQRLAKCILEHVVAVSGLPSRKVRSDRERFHATGMAVLRHSLVPATLVELGYINNVKDRTKLLDDEFQQRVAEAMLEGIREFIEGPLPQEASR